MKSFLDDLRALYPSLHIRETVDTSDEILHLATRSSLSGLDAGVVGALPPETLECIEVFRDRSVLIVPPADPLCLWGIERISEEDLRHLLLRNPPFGGRSPSSGTHKAVLSYLAPRLGMHETAQLLARISLYNMEQVVDFVSRGGGISIVPGCLVENDVRAKRVWAVELPGDSTRSWYGFWHKDREQAPAAQELVRLFKARQGAREVCFEPRRAEGV